LHLQIKQIRQANYEEWDSIVNLCEYATYFHSREWAQIWEEYSDSKQQKDPKIIIFTDHKSALFPLSYTKSVKGLVKDYVSSPAGTFGGWLSEDHLEESHIHLLLEYAKGLNIVMRQNPYDKLLCQLDVDWSLEDFTQAIDLSGGFESVYNLWQQGGGSTLRKSRKAKREGVIVKVADSLSEWNEYFECYQESLERWGDKVTSNYQWRLFEIFFKRNSSHVKLWLALYDNQIIGGAICFYMNKHVVYWHGASKSLYHRKRPINLLMYEIIRDACENQYHWFDFNPSGKHESVVQFKNSFRPKKLVSHVLFNQTKMKKIVVKLRKFRSLISESRSNL
jgi:hypothetical protein